MCVVLMACPDPPPEIAGDRDGKSDGSDDGSDPGGKSGDPDKMDLSPGGTTLLDMEAVKPQHTQEELLKSTEPTIKISGELQGTCEGGTVRIDVIELGVEHEPTGPIIGPVTALLPPSTGPYSIVVPKGKNVQVAALCDVDKDQKIVQGTDKLAPGIALGVIDEDKDGVDLAFAGEGGRETPLPDGAPEAGTGPGDVPPGDATASSPSAEDGAEGVVEPPPEATVEPPPEAAAE